MEAKKKRRQALRGVFTRCARETEEALRAEPIDLDAVVATQEVLTEKFENLRSADQQVFEAILEASSEADLELELDSCLVYEKRYVALKLAVQKAQESIEGAPSEKRSSRNGEESVASSIVSGRRKFKLPVIELVKFGGNVKEWLPFWNQFRKIDEDTTIDESDKLQYLAQATVPGSKARRLVESFPAVRENYESVIAALKSRYGREDLLIEVYIRDLLELVLSSGVSGKVDLATLYDHLEAHMRALDTLGVTADKCAAMLFPLVESCVPRELLRIWQRSSEIPWVDDTGEENLMEKRLSHLMKFLKLEVENEQRLQLASGSFKADRKEGVTSLKSRQSESTAAALINSEDRGCVFCGKSHSGATCDKASGMRLWQVKKHLIRSNACFRCCQTGHRVRDCRVQTKCQYCSQAHATVLCSHREKGVSKVEASKGPMCDKDATCNKVLSNYSGTLVFLQTLTVKVKGSTSSKLVRVLLDTGSQRSYILASTAETLGCDMVREEEVIHCLFGGVSSPKQRHNVYSVRLFNDDYACDVEALDQPIICNEISSIINGPWTQELQELGITCNSLADTGRIEILLGADIVGHLYTGRKRLLKCGLVAIETVLGWTVMGKVRCDDKYKSSTMAVSSLLSMDMPIERLWELDVLGIAEPREKKAKDQRARETLEFFQRSVTHDIEGRYVVRLPWIDDHPALPSNYGIAKKRLSSVNRKLRDRGLWQAYNDVLRQWEQGGVIEQVNAEINGAFGHYLPHRPVIKESSTTTKIRPVFDASAREANKPSLNDCLETGMNYVELIPSMLTRFRQFRKGVVADIRQAFLQIAVHESDRDFLRFLWSDESGNEMVFRHRRVVFGVNSSPFILGAVINFHLERLKQRAIFDQYSEETLTMLRNSFYVDNVVTSLEDDNSVCRFRREAIAVLEEAAFDLRGWESTVMDEENGCNVPVLGLTWNTYRDTLSLNRDNILDITDSGEGVVTKRSILSAAQRVFDPVGFTCPVSVCPKILLRKAWELGLKWDEPVGEEIERAFKKWSRELELLTNVEVPRWLNIDRSGEARISLHTFCDASGDAYAAVVFLRVVRGTNVSIRLIAAKSRIAPIKKEKRLNLTTPRLELLAATIGSRLYSRIKADLSCPVECHFWSDSTTVIAWIQRCEPWAVFVGNRVVEIRDLTPVAAWRHVPGAINPADLPSRGCTPETLFRSKWWEGPSWLYGEEATWPSGTLQYDEEAIGQELRKDSVVTLVQDCTDIWHLKYFSSYAKTVRMIAWVYRFVFNARNTSRRRTGELSGEEYKRAELFVLKLIQRDSFTGEMDKRLALLHPSVDKSGVIRAESRVSNRTDRKNFRFPIILPKDHEVVSRLIYDRHVKSCHAGTNMLLSILREKYWIIGGRRTVRSVVSRCVICKRHNMPRLNIAAPCLPVDRVRDAYAFEVTGIDYAGPLYLRNGEKAWVCLFTCAVYRAIHLELVTSMSTAAFLQAFRRFVARRGRPNTVYTDNGTNFVGAANEFSKIDWENVSRDLSIDGINWKFNPPSSPWWGGFFERMVGLVKGLLRKTLGTASLNYEDLVTVLCECEATINARPLTYMPGDTADLVTLTPAMFLGQVAADGLPECNLMDQATLCRRYRYLQSLVDQLRKRFRSEYLGSLKWSSSNKGSPEVSVGEIVLVGDDNKKRLNWCLGRIAEVIKGNDGVIRLVRVNTVGGQLLRPLARIYPLEIGISEDQEHVVVPDEADVADTDQATNEFIEPQRHDIPKMTSRGRQIKLPLKFST